MNRVTKNLKKSEERILKVLQDRKEHRFTDLKKETGLSLDSLNDSLKSLQLPQKTRKVERSVESRKYSITKEGSDYLTRDELSNTIRNHSVKVETSLPVNSIIALDIPGISAAQQRTFMAGTPLIAKACFDQFYVDMQKTKGAPTSGRFVYTVSIDASKVKDWLETAEGKNYVITKLGLDEEKES